MADFPYPEHGGNLRWAAEAFGREPGDFLDFSSSLNPLGPPPAVREFVERLARGSPAAWRCLAAYPDPEAREARRALAGFLGVPEEAVLVTNGGTEAIRLLVLFWRDASAGRGATPSLVTWAPAFGEYERAARPLGMPVIRALMDLEGSLRGGDGPRFQRRAGPREEGEGSRGRASPRFLCPSTSALLPLARPGTLFFLCHPHSPTGAWADPEEMLRFHRSLPPGAALAVDEAFLWLAERAWSGGAGFRSLAREAAEREGLFVVGSLTKAFSLPGVRLGYVAARPEAVRRMEDLQPAWSASGLGQALIPLCLREAEEGYLSRTLDLLRREKRRIEEAFSRDPVLSRAFRLFPTEANFYLARELAGEDGVRGEERREGRSPSGKTGRFFERKREAASESSRGRGIEVGRGSGSAAGAALAQRQGDEVLVQGQGREPLFVRLGRRGVLVRDLSSVPGLGGGYFRFAVRREEENLILIQALKEAASAAPAHRLSLL